MTPKEEKAALVEQINALTAEMRSDRLAREAMAAEDGRTLAEDRGVRIRAAFMRGWAQGAGRP